MNPRRALAAVLAVAVIPTAVLAGCGSSATSSGASATSSGGSATSPATSPVTASSTLVTTAPARPAPGSGGRTMSAPHIVCLHAPFTMHYDGAQSHPVEACVQAGTAGRIVITEPVGATWPLPLVSPARVVSIHATRSGRTLIVSVTAAQHGTAMLAVPGTSWQLEIAVP